MGSAAIGLPALANALVSKRARRLPVPTWGTGDVYRWRFGDVVYQRLGEGPSILLLHSLGPGHSASEWRNVAERLAQRHTVIVPDLLGWGQSAKPAISYDGEIYIELVRDLLVDVVASSTVIVAAGMPAAYVLQVAVDQPELVSALGLVVPFGIGLHGDEPDLKDAVVNRLLRLPIIGTSALNIFTSRSGIASYLRREVYAADNEVDEDLVDEHYRNSHQQGAHASLAAYLSGYLNHGAHDLLGRIEQPVWIAWGRRATSPAVESADLWLRELVDAELEVFEHCGSLPHAESPDEFVLKLEEFVSSSRAA